MKRKWKAAIAALGAAVLCINGSETMAPASEMETHALILAQENFGGSAHDRFAAVTAALGEGYVAAGESYYGSFGTGDWEGEEGHSGDDAIIVRYDEYGQILWKSYFGGDDIDKYYGVTTAEDGYVAVGYSAYKSFGTGDWEGEEGHSRSDAIIVKYDDNGNVIWKNHFHGTWGNSDDKFTAVIAAEDGYVAVGTVGGGTLSDASIVKYDLDGNQVWASSIGEDSRDEFWGVTTVNGGYVAVGSSQSRDLGHGVWEGLEGRGADDAIAVKYDTDGNVLWKQNFGGSSFDNFYAAAEAEDGFVAAGYSYRNSFGNGDWTGVTGQDSGILVKYDSDGMVQWKQKVGGSFRSVTSTGDGYLAVGDIYSGWLGEDEWADREGYGGKDAIAVKTDAQGDIEWKECFGGSADDFFYSVAAGEDSYVAVGYSQEGSFGTEDWESVEGKGSEDGTFVHWMQLDGPVSYYSVSFNLRGGTGSIPEQTVVEYGLAEMPEVTPERPGYVFKGWYLGEERWDFEDNIVTEDITLRAKWEPEEYVRKTGKNLFDGNGYIILPFESGRTFSLGTGATTYNTIEWSSWRTTNENVLSIQSSTNNNCTVRMVSPGTCEIQATVQSSYTYYDALLKRPVTHYGHDEISHRRRLAAPVTSVSLQETLSIDVGEEKLLDYDSEPSSNYSRAVSSFGFASSDVGVAVVDEEGFVTGTGYGTAEITASTEGGISAICRVTVEKHSEPVTPPKGDEPSEPVTPPKEDEPAEDPSKVYTYQILKDGTAEITGYTGTNTSLSLPASLDGRAVTSIAENIFAGNSSLKAVRLPEGIKSVASGAFAWCTGLKEVHLPGSVQTIGQTAFYNCSSLSDLTLPDGVTSVGEFAFYGCSGLTAINIPAKTASIGEDAFGNCKSLKHVYYEGSSTQWNNIKIGANNTSLTGADIHFDSKKPASPGASCSHTWKTETDPATEKRDGSKIVKCSKCGTVKSQETIPFLKTISLTKKKYAYNGKAQKPSVIVKDSKNNALSEGRDYHVSYPKGRKNVGVYTVTITFTGNYKGTAKREFSIVPKTVKMKRLSAKRNGFSVKWQKQTKQTSGYEITYALDKRFKKGRGKAVIKKNKITSRTVTGLKARKKYYVRIRTFKTIKADGWTRTFYSGWSKVKTVTTKK